MGISIEEFNRMAAESKKRKKDDSSLPFSITGKKRKPGSKSSRSRLIEKCDTWFSKYIRLRDAEPNGYFRCISCGKVKAFRKADCGHYFSRTHMATRYDEDNCNAECSYCLTPDALIFTSDLLWKRLGDVKEGDKLFGFAEFKNERKSRPYEESTVTHIHREFQEVYEVTLENGDVIKTTADHQWLCRVRETGYSWVKTKDMWINGVNMRGQHKTGPHTEKTTSIVCKIINTIHQDLSYESGWIAGMIDADGHITQQTIHDKDGHIRYGFRVGVAQSSKYMDICKRIVELLEYFTGNHKPCRQFVQGNRNTVLKSNYNTWQYLITGTNIEKLQFLMRVRPNKMKKVDINKLGCLKSKYDTKVKSIKFAGVQEIVVMETSSHTFIANGYAMHNCNRMSSEHLIGYQVNLIKKIGQQRFDLLNVRHNQTKHWSDFELEELCKHYKDEVKRLSKEKGIKI